MSSNALIKAVEGLTPCGWKNIDALAQAEGQLGAISIGDRIDNL
jgi:hypothetical protein